MGYSYDKQKTNSSIKVVLKKSIDFSYLVLFQFHYTDEEGSYDKADKEATVKLEELRKAKPKPFKTDVQCRAIVALACYCCSELHSPAMNSYVASLEGNPHNYRTLISGGGEGGFIDILFRYVQSQLLSAAGDSEKETVARMMILNCNDTPVGRLKVQLRGAPIPSLVEISETNVGKSCKSLMALLAGESSYQKVASMIGYSHLDDEDYTDHFRLDDDRKVYFEDLLDSAQLERMNITWVQEGYGVYKNSKNMCVTANIQDYKPVGPIYISLAEAERKGVIVRSSEKKKLRGTYVDPRNILSGKSKRKRTECESEDSDSGNESDMNDEHLPSRPSQPSQLSKLSSSLTSSPTSTSYNSSNSSKEPVSTIEDFVGRECGRVFTGPEVSMLPNFLYLLPSSPLRSTPANVLELIYHGGQLDEFSHALIKADKLNVIDREASYLHTGTFDLPFDATDIAKVCNFKYGKFASEPIGHKFGSELTTKQVTSIDGITIGENVNRVEFTAEGMRALCKLSEQVATLYRITEGGVRFIGYKTALGNLTFSLNNGTTVTCKVEERDDVLRGLSEKGIFPCGELFSAAESEVVDDDDDEEEEVTKVGEGGVAIVGEQFDLGTRAGAHTDGHRGVPSNRCRLIGGTCDRTVMSTNLTHKKSKKHKDADDVATLIAQPGTIERTYFVVASLANAFGDENLLRRKGKEPKQM